MFLILILIDVILILCLYGLYTHVKSLTDVIAMLCNNSSIDRSFWFDRGDIK